MTGARACIAWCSLCVAFLASARPLGAQGGTIGGHVTTQSGAPLAGARVTLDDSVATVATDDAGFFRIANVAAGGHTLLVRKIGFVPVENFLRTDRGEQVRRDFPLRGTVDSLPRVVVVGDAGEPLPPKLVEFERRRTWGVGHFIGPEELAKHNDVLAGSVLRLLPGLALMRGSGQAQYPVNPRGPGGIRPQSANSCPVTVYVDGILTSDRYFDVNSIQKSELSAVEYYAGPAEVPAQYGGTGRSCGVMLLWTR